jgi:hypothetical protein
VQQPKILFDRLCNKPFWIWDIEQHKKEDIRTKGDCCFNHIIGLPSKEKEEKPIFDYEKLLLYDVLLIPDVCQMCIVIGPNIDMAVKLIKRMKGILKTAIAKEYTR